MSIGAYCQSCRSAFCNHCLQINEHNMRMERDRMMAGMGNMVTTMQPEMVMRIEEGSSITLVTDTPKNKKLLLLSRRGK